MWLNLLAAAESPNGQPRDTSHCRVVESCVRSLPFDLHRNYLIVVKGSSADVNDLNFLIDTGSDPTVVDRRLASRLGLQTGNARVGVPNGTIERAILRDLMIGPVQSNQVSVLVQDLSFIEKGLKVRIDALVGLDVLGLSSFTINYASMHLCFGRPAPMPFSAPLHITSHLPWVLAKANDQPARLLVDTGASALRLFTTYAKGRLPNLPVRQWQSTETTGGRLPGELALLNQLSIGGAHFGRTAAFIVEDEQHVGSDVDGLLSPPALRLKQVSFDFERHVLGWCR